MFEIIDRSVKYYKSTGSIAMDSLVFIVHRTRFHLLLVHRQLCFPSLDTLSAPALNLT